MSPDEFRNNYYLKSELMDFCKSVGLSAYGRKPDLTERIAYYLSTGREMPVKKEKRSQPPAVFSLDTLIEENITCSERHRAFFKSQIGEGFKYNVQFIQWLRKNPGKTYADAIEQFYAIAESRKGSRT
ncbi:MAG: SAP domain-containing protein, partial [Candidatus Methanoplasma sp.]|nr:SAP domain-containing protein [Candidatus Methanoplasma sp.]